MSESDNSARSDSISIRFNGEEISTGATTIYRFLEERGVDPTRKGIALAVNQSVVPRSEWNDHLLQPGDRLEVITAMQGG